MLLQHFSPTNVFPLILVISQNPHSCFWLVERYRIQSLIYCLDLLSRLLFEDIIQFVTYKLAT